MTKVNLDELEALEKAAKYRLVTAYTLDGDLRNNWMLLPDIICYRKDIIADNMTESDARFYAAMRNHFKPLLEELKAAREFMPSANTAKQIVKATKLLLSSEGLDHSQLKLYLRSLIQQYDEVTGGEK